MATLLTNPGTAEVPLEEERLNYLNVSHGWKSWLLTVDHKRIALLYLFSITLMFFIGGTFAILVRLHLTSPTGIFAPETYNRLFTMHGCLRCLQLRAAVWIRDGLSTLRTARRIQIRMFWRRLWARSLRDSRPF